MLIGFFLHLRQHRIPVSTIELLDCLAMLKSRLAFANIEDFYFLSRLTLVKDEKYFDRFDLAFGSYFEGQNSWVAPLEANETRAILMQLLVEYLSPGDIEEVNCLLTEYDAARQQLNQQREAAMEETGDPVSGTGDLAQPSVTAADQDQEGRRIDANDDDEIGEVGEVGEVGKGDVPATDKSEDEGEGEGEGEGNEGDEGQGDGGQKGQGDNGEVGEGNGLQPATGTKTDVSKPGNQSAAKVWQQRQYQDYDPDIELGTRNLKMALRRLRKFARTSAELELDLAGTISATARNGGLLDIREIPERHNSVKVLLFLDVGGSMDEHVELCAQLFSAARSEFKYLEYYYFHNFVYESLWPDNQRRQEDRIPVFDVIRRFGPDYKVIFVGDANMARHEIAEKGGSVEHYNAEPGQAWLARLQEHFRKVIWLNPSQQSGWQDSYSTVMIQRLLEDKMFPLSVEGIEQAMKFLGR